MASIKDNIIFDKTSFLEGTNSAFIEELYLKYIISHYKIEKIILQVLLVKFFQAGLVNLIL